MTNGFNFENSNGIKSSKIISGTNFTIDNTKYTGTINDLGTSEFTLTVTVNNAGTNIDVFFNMTLTVTGPETYSVTLHTNGGTISEGKDVTSYTEWTGAALPSSADITNEGNVFKGWFDNAELSGNAVTSILTTDTGNKEYWAKWESDHTHNFSYSADGATITANCGNERCDLTDSKAALTIVKPDKEKYGDDKEAKIP